ncbi:hypothetical protein [Halarchaeum sp. P4]|uniref:hypothetical protein n=1 Tax=Halarchaeum sp. P4 TaxID=3421639 RepID=UPI003EBCB452
MDTRSRRDRLLTAGGALAIPVGTSLPWVRLNPTLPPDAEIPTLRLAGASPGIEAFDVALLGLVALVLLVGAGTRPRLRFVVTVAAGVGTVSLCAFFLSTSSLVGFTATFVPALGWYLTVLGGALFAVTGGRHLLSMLRSRTALTA